MSVADNYEERAPNGPLNSVEDIAAYLRREKLDGTVVTVGATGYIDLHGKVGTPLTEFIARSGWVVSDVLSNPSAADDDVMRVWFSEFGEEEREVTRTETVVCFE